MIIIKSHKNRNLLIRFIPTHSRKNKSNQKKANASYKNFLFSLHILPNVRTNSLFHTVKYKNHSVGYIFHTVGYKSRTVKQRILKGKIKYAAGHPDFIAGAAGNIRRTRQKKS